MASPYVWNGSTWLNPSAFRVWNGTEWRLITDTRIWTGSLWLEDALDTPLDTQTVGVGFDSGIDPEFSFTWDYSGFSSTGQYPNFIPFGTITDGTSNIYSGAAITELYTDNILNSLTLTITGAANSGWNTMYVNNIPFARTSATYASGTWIWACNSYIWATPNTTVKFI